MAGRETGMQQQAGVVGALPGLVGASGAGTLLSVKTDGLAHEEERKAAVREGMGVVEFRHFQKALQTSAAAQAKPGGRTTTTPAASGSEGVVGEKDDEDTALAMMLSAQMEADKLVERLKKLREHKKAKKVGGVHYRLPKVEIRGDGRCYARALAHATFTKDPRAFRKFLWKKLKVRLPAGKWNFATVSLKGFVWWGCSFSWGSLCESYILVSCIWLSVCLLCVLISAMPLLYVTKNTCLSDAHTQPPTHIHPPKTGEVRDGAGDPRRLAQAGRDELRGGAAGG